MVSLNNNILLYSGPKAVFSQYKVVPKDRNTRDHLAWTFMFQWARYTMCVHSTQYR